MCTAEGDAEGIEPSRDVKLPEKKRRESGMLKQVKRELAEEAAARKAASASNVATGSGPSTTGKVQTEEPKQAEKFKTKKAASVGFDAEAKDSKSKSKGTVAKGKIVKGKASVGPAMSKFKGSLVDRKQSTANGQTKGSKRRTAS